MPLHPQAQSLVNALGGALAFDFGLLTAAELRAAFEIPAIPPAGPALARIEERTIPGAAGPMRARVYRPTGPGPFPITLYLHGGGFVMGGPEATDGICQALAAHGQTLVISPAYRLAPETPFPGGLEDAWAALTWAQDEAEAMGGLADRFAVAGDSSGGNFAAVLAHRAHDAGRRLSAQLLLYPVLDGAADAPSWTEFATGYLLSAELMRWFWRQYCPDPKAAEDPAASPARRRDFAGLAPAIIFTAEYDVLRDEAEAYAARLEAAGAPTLLKRWDGQIHGFLLRLGEIDDAALALEEAGRALRAAFAA